MTSDAGFNAGIETAARWMDELSKQAKTVAGLSEYAENCRISAQNIRALKRPEPSEAEKVERLALWLFQNHQAQPYPITWERAAEIGKERFRQQARAALKAMEG